jgi:hypothetical protein
MRKGFGIITAIIIMMTVATLMSLMIGLSTSTVKKTTDIYLKQQAEFLLRSSTEFALLAISGHNNSANCVENINITYNSFTAKVNIWYLGNGIPTTCSNILDNSVITSDSNYTAVIDVVVTNNQSTEPIRLHRRTIQKP